MTNAVTPSHQSKRTAYERLPRRYKRFVDLFVSGATTERAMIESGYTGRYPRQLATKLLRKPQVTAAIEEATERHVADIGARQATVLRQMHAIATSDVAKLFKEDGALKAPHELDEETRAAIAAIEIEDVSKEGFSGTRYKYKFWDKVKANDRLGQYVKLWEARQTNVNVDARSVTVNVDRGSQEALRVLADIGASIAALGSGQAATPADQDRPLLPAEVCDGSPGRGASVDAGANSGDPEQP